jgi:hypothetical protein
MRALRILVSPTYATSFRLVLKGSIHYFRIRAGKVLAYEDST